MRGTWGTRHPLLWKIDGCTNYRSHLHDFGFFSVGELFHAADLFVGHLLDLFERALLLVLADLLFLGHLLEGVVAVAADVADGGAMLLELAVDVLAGIAAALLGHGGDGDAEDLAVGGGVE